MNAKTTFLNEDLKDEVYMKQSKCFIKQSNLVHIKCPKMYWNKGQMKGLL
jgi:hypothetical protein